MINLSFDEELKFCNKYRIDPNELLFIRMCELAQSGDNPNTVKKYFSMEKDSRGSVTDMLLDLQSKGIVLKEYKVPKAGEKFSPSEVKFNKTFTKSLYKSSFSLGKELFDQYPISCIVNGVEVRLRSISKKFDSLEDAFFAYGKAIRFSETAHKKILELIEWGKNNSFVFGRLDNFIVDMDWVNIQAIKNGGMVNNSAMKLV